MNPEVNKRMPHTLAALACVVSLFLSGCAMDGPPPPAKPAAVPEVGSEQWLETQRPILMARAEDRWNALIKGDMEKVYLFTSPAYRSVVSLQQYKGKYGRTIEWLMARADKVSYDGPAVATVSVDVTYRVGLLKSRGESIEMHKAMTEKWIYTDREWWYTSN